MNPPAPVLSRAASASITSSAERMLARGPRVRCSPATISSCRRRVRSRPSRPRHQATGCQVVSAARSRDELPGGPQMIVMFSARRLKPGAWEAFRRAWDPGEEMPPGFQRAYHARNIRDEDEVISFGLFDMSEEDYRRWRAEVDAQETQRVSRLSAFVQHEIVSGVYEVIDAVE